MRRKWKGSRVILPVLLSVIMAVEPVGAVATVHAEEIVEPIETAEQDQGESAEEDQKDQLGDGAEGTVEDNGQDQEGEPGQIDDGQKTEDNSGTEAGGAKDSDIDDTDKEEEPSENPSGTEDEKGQGTEEGKDQETEDGDTDEPPKEELPEDETLEEKPEEGAGVEEDTVSGNDLEAEEPETEDGALNGFTGMPSTYKLTSAQMESKRSLSAHMGEIGGLHEGSDYAKGEVITEAESQEEAELIAKAYNAEIVSFKYGVLTLKLGEDVSVGDAMKVAADTDLNLPAVWPNYYRYLLEDGDSIDEDASETSYLAVLAENDEYLQPNSSKYQWHHAAVGSPYAWAEGYKGQGIKVAVLDSGVAANTDLPSVTNLNSDGGNDAQGHGTHVAGIIGARANGQLGVGVAPEATLFSYNLGAIQSSDIVAGIKAASGISETPGRAESAPVDIINMSIGGLGWNGEEANAIAAAYNKGVAIFASSGNDGGQTYSYPACYDHVISVAATDKGNERASFSSYCDKVDLSAPGVEIWSASNSDLNGYVSMQGTSMACPVAAGEAAVILSGNDELRNMSGGSRVDELESLMKKNAIKAGSGMGAGITSLTKVFGLSTADAKPMAPGIEIVPDEQSLKVTVKITAPQGGMDIYYTTNGKNPAFKNGEPDAKTDTKAYIGFTETNPLVVEGSAKITVKAIAVNESGVSSAVTSESYSLSPYVTEIKITGVNKVVPGKSIQLSATVLPAYATNKRVKWSLQTKDGKELSSEVKSKLSVSNSGKVAAKSGVPCDTYKVVAEAQDNGHLKAEYEITVIESAGIKNVKFDTKTIALALPNDQKYSLWQHLEPETVKPEDASKLTSEDFKWSSNKTSVAEVGDNGEVIPHMAGKATITALANDSSGKKASVTVTVTQLAEKITVSGPAKVARGKSAAFKAVIEPAGVTNKKVKWEILDKNGNPASAAEASISASGKVSVKSGASGIYTVKATAQDVNAETGSAPIEVAEGVINKISFVNSADKSITLFRKDTAYAGKAKAEVAVKIEGTSGAALDAYTVSSSNPGIVTGTGTLDTEKGIITLAIAAKGKAVGKAKITVAATDGSNKKLVCNVSVVNPVSSITVAPAAGNSGAVAQGKSLQLKARVESGNGVISNKNVTWEMYTMEWDIASQSWVTAKKVDTALGNSLGVKIAANGKVTAAKEAKASTKISVVNTQTQETAEVEVAVPYRVRATTKDGSGTYGEYTVTVGKCATFVRTCWDPTQEGNNPEYNWGVILSGGIDAKWIDDPKYLYPYVENKGYMVGVLGNCGQGGYSVSSSNPEVVSVSYEGEYANLGYMYFRTYKPGTATITIKAMDGSGAQVQYKYVVFTQADYDKLFN